jgi:hypothetical protein
VSKDFNAPQTGKSSDLGGLFSTLGLSLHLKIFDRSASTSHCPSHTNPILDGLKNQKRPFGKLQSIANRQNG